MTSDPEPFIFWETLMSADTALTAVAVYLALCAAGCLAGVVWALAIRWQHRGEQGLQDPAPTAEECEEIWLRQWREELRP